jgi:NAD(P) transhydrogenase subunit alpha
MRLGVAKETVPGERRVALTPEVVGSLISKELGVVIESGSGDAAGYLDADYAAAGAARSPPWSMVRSTWPCGHHPTG